MKYGLGFQIEFKFFKAAHVAIFTLTGLCSQVAQGSGACSTQLP